MMRTGRLSLDPSFERADWTELSVEVIRVRMAEAIKFSTHHAALSLLKVWIKTSHSVKQLDRTVRAKLLAFLHKNGHAHGGISGSPSAFLRNIKKHKNEALAGEKHEHTEE